MMLILFCIFALQNDTTIKDSVEVDTFKIQQDLDIINSDLDSIIAILKKDTIK